MRIVWSPLAIERAYEAAAYIAGDKPEAALRWLDGLFAVTDRLEMFPESEATDAWCRRSVCPRFGK